MRLFTSQLGLAAWEILQILLSSLMTFFNQLDVPLKNIEADKKYHLFLTISNQSHHICRCKVMSENRLILSSQLTAIISPPVKLSVGCETFS